MAFRKRWSLPWLLGGALLLYPLLAFAGNLVPWVRLSQFFTGFWGEHGWVLAPLVVMALGPYVILFLLALSGFSLGSPAPSRGELDRLIAQKHGGTLLNRSRQVRESAAKRSRYFSVGPSAAPDPTSLFAEKQVVDRLQEQVLDRLLRCKRAWPGSSGSEPPTFEEHIVAG